MKTIEELKQEQYDLKAKLHEVIELINGEEYYKLSDSEKSLINQQRTGMELYLSSLSKRIYGSPDTPDASNLIWLSMLYGMFNSTSSWNSSSSTDYLKEKQDKPTFDKKEDSLEEEPTEVTV